MSLADRFAPILHFHEKRDAVLVAACQRAGNQPRRTQEKPACQAGRGSAAHAFGVLGRQLRDAAAADVDPFGPAPG